jgi:hypothetical protein
MRRSVLRSLISFSRSPVTTFAIAAALLCAAVIFGMSGCATTKVPPIKTYEEAKKDVEARGALVSDPIETREGYSEGTSVPLLKGAAAPHSGVLLDEAKTRYYIAIKAERDRRRKELEAARKNAAIQEIIHNSALEHIDAKVKANNTWWERNKGLMGLAFGTVIGISLVVGVLYAVTGGKGASTTANAHVLP